MSSFGTAFRVTTWGESHAKSVGCVIDGCPPGLAVTEGDIQPQLTRRRPGQSQLTTPRDETDTVFIQAGTERGLTLGTPICLLVNNLNVKPGDYAEMANVPRPGHADATYQFKYGLQASSGGGRASARETIGRVAAGAVAEKFLRQEYATEIVSFVSSIGHVEMPQEEVRAYTRTEVDNLGTLRFLRGTCKQSTWRKQGDTSDEAVFVAMHPEDEHAPCYVDCHGVVYSRNGVVVSSPSNLEAALSCNESAAIRCPHPPTACRMATLIRQVKAESDSIGGTVACVCTNVPVGLGEPCFDKLEALMAHAMLSLPATKGFEIGLGFRSTHMRGSQHNDPFCAGGPAGITPKTNNAGGTLGGISTGAPILMRVAVKPVSTIGRPQSTVSYQGEQATLEAKGRHDACVLPRTPPLVEAMAALVLADLALIQRKRLGGSSTMPDLIRAGGAPPVRATTGAAPAEDKGERKKIKL